MDWYKNSAERGNAEAQRFLGNKHITEGAKHEAVKWFALSAKSGDIAGWIDLRRMAIVDKIPEAQFALGQLFSDGCCLGVKKNEANALKLFEMAAKQGYEPAKKAIEKMKGLEP